MTTQNFTGFEYLLIDVANSYGMDKLTYDERIQWAYDHFDTLEQLAEESQWKERPLYLKAVQAIRTATKGIATGHLVGFDAVCSGLQIMSAITGCISGGKSTGLVDTGERPDAYTDCTKVMNRRLGSESEIPRKDIKTALMTYLYGSKKEPENLFGEDTIELQTFHASVMEIGPGATKLLTGLINSWNAFALNHAWQLPDGFDVDIKVMDTEEKRIEVDELGGASFTYQYKINRGLKRGVKNAANVVHSLDSYLLRSLIRRCNYDPEWTRNWLGIITETLLERELFGGQQALGGSHELQQKIHRYRESMMADITILDAMAISDLQYLSSQHLRRLAHILDMMLAHEPFPIVTVHDEFKCHPNNMNQLRFHYREIMAELAESDVLADIMTQLRGGKVTINKLSQDLPQYIRESNYAIC